MAADLPAKTRSRQTVRPGMWAERPNLQRRMSGRRRLSFVRLEAINWEKSACPWPSFGGCGARLFPDSWALCKCRQHAGRRPLRAVASGSWAGVRVLWASCQDALAAAGPSRRSNRV